MDDATGGAAIRVEFRRYMEIKSETIPACTRVIRRYQWMYYGLEVTSYAATAFAALLAALLPKDHFDLGWKIALASLPVGARAASWFLSQFHVRSMLRLRERGRIRLETILAKYKGEFATARSTADVEAAYDGFVRECDELELQQQRDAALLDGDQGQRAPERSTGMREAGFHSRP